MLVKCGKFMGFTESFEDLALLQVTAICLYATFFPDVLKFYLCVSPVRPRPTRH